MSLFRYSKCVPTDKRSTAPCLILSYYNIQKKKIDWIMCTAAEPTIYWHTGLSRTLGIEEKLSTVPAHDNAYKHLTVQWIVKSNWIVIRKLCMCILAVLFTRICSNICITCWCFSVRISYVYVCVYSKVKFGLKYLQGAINWTIKELVTGKGQLL